MSDKTIPSENSAPEDKVIPPAQSPYPGLRPFQPEDSEYFFGRDQPVRDVVNRLQTERFVVVIGGSGSGKSSLVLAGAIPRLRSFAIKEAGDFWIPIVTTPGTNPTGADTPLRRLATKFCAQLAEPINESPAQRLENCIALLRMPRGLGAVIDRYGSDVRDLDGVDPGNLKVNYLFLIDQFEELFHRTNRTAGVDEDCSHLVDRIVEHSKTEFRHAQVCVALTMRSEHLNDCPRYENLPDAINIAFYLVRRLDESQIALAIQQPALRYLRRYVAAERQARRFAMFQRQEYTAALLPGGIAFAPELLDRLLRDAKGLLGDQDHADQLPLLQHLLFWIWNAACMRTKSALVPDHLTLDDLNRAVFPGTDKSPVTLLPDVNALKLCLDNRCEDIFLRESGARQLAWEKLFRNLAFKEPNSGSYTQQRAEMKDLSQLLGESPDDHFAALYQHLLPWRVPHGYLHWDIESTTVKVAHETLIRRWARFRNWTDENDKQFQIFMRMLDDCREWTKLGRKQVNLASGNSLLLYEGLALEKALIDPTTRFQLRRLLDLDHEGQSLTAFFGNDQDFASARNFLQRSLENRQLLRDKEIKTHSDFAVAESVAIADKERASRRLGYAFVMVIMVALLGIVSMALSMALNDLSEKERMLHRSYALAAETRANFSTQFKEYSQPQYALRSSLQAAQFFIDGGKMQTTAASLINGLPLFGFFESRLDALRTTEILAEAQATANLRQTLLGVPWLLKSSTSGVTDQQADSEQCSATMVSLSSKQLLAVRSLLVDHPSDAGFSILQAIDKCSPGKNIISVPPGSGVVGIGVDARLQNLIVFFKEYYQIYTLNWTNERDPRIDPRAVVYVKANIKKGITKLITRTGDFSTDLVIGDSSVRLFETSPQLADLTSLNAQIDLVRVDGKNDDSKSICRVFHAARDPREIDSRPIYFYGYDPSPNQMDSQGNRAICVVVAQQSSGPVKWFSADVFAFATDAAARDRAKRVPILQNVPLGSEAPTALKVLNGGKALAFESRKGWQVVPLTLDAWRMLATEVFEPASNFKELSKSSPELSRPYDLIMSTIDSGRTLSEEERRERDKLLKKHTDSLVTELPQSGPTGNGQAANGR